MVPDPAIPPPAPEVHVVKLAVVHTSYVPAATDELN